MAPQPETANSAAGQEPATTAIPAPPSLAPSGTDGAPSKAKLGAISPPLPWPSPKIQEIARPVRPRFSELPPEVISPRSTSAPVRNVPPMAVPPADESSGESASRPSFLSRLRTQRDAASELFRSGRQRAARTLLRTRAVAGRLEARVGNLYQLSKLRRQIQDVQRMAAERAGSTPVDPTPPLETQPSLAVRERLFSLLATIRGAAERAIGYTRLTCGRAVVATRDRMNNSAEAARAFRIKVKFQRPDSTTLESWLARGKKARLNLARRDSRLWISMGMAALSAVLALLVISGVRRYAPDTSAPKVSRNAPPNPVAQPAAIAVPKPSPATRPASSKPVRPAAKRASLSARGRKGDSPKAPRKKMRHHEEDGYVAKDTYVYYGANGKANR